MTLLQQKNVKDICLLIITIFCLSVTGCSKQLYQYSAPTEAQHYPVLKYSLIELIDALPKSMPTTTEKVQSLFNHQLHLNSENEFFTFYDGGPFITKDGVVITALDVRARKKSKLPVEMIDFSLDQRQCVSTELLKKKYGFYILSLLSPHPVKHPFISYSIKTKERSFGVETTSDNKNCATSIGVYGR
ncbi:unnamed protein product [Commensalibacter communis]|uniref:hypothetical protein n=1 Tax=Commensalibacter communis TaxID=2972786 RepID=UPI0022FF8A87|nr:hypothetical protein [Commensalibacter communis]CAI3940501.1 unnamed protein product [Commensalibacter communis]